MSSPADERRNDQNTAMHFRDPNYQGPFGNTLLHGAAATGDVREVKRLLAAGADPGILNRQGHSALRIAVLAGYPAVYHVLADRGGDRIEAKLDEALEATFPASDPVALSVG